VISMDDWTTIKNLKAKNPDMSLREIAKYVHVSHNTVKKALEGKSPPKYEKKPKGNHNLEPFKEEIFDMVNIKKFVGSRILEEIKLKGYKGGKTAFYCHLEKVKIDQKQKFFIPYETGPSVQSQYDWSPYTVKIGKDLAPVYIFLYINSFSRYEIYEASLSQTQGAVFEALENSFAECNGIPERIQTDNAKAFVVNASKNNFRWNDRYLHFCGHYGFAPSRSMPGHPWSKGKVEKPFSYLENHFIAGGEFESFEDLQLKLKAFQKQKNQRLHSTTKALPEELFLKEQPSLIPLPQTRYVGVKEEVRKVTSDCLISYNGSRYSVPWMFACKHVWIRVSRGYNLEVYSQNNKLVATHKLSLKKSAVVIENEHYRGNNSDRGNFCRLKSSFLSSFPANELFLEKLQAQKRKNASYQLFRIIEISKMYACEDFIAAINESLSFNVFNSNFMSGFLEKNYKQKFAIELSHYRRHISDEVCVNIKRNMDEYSLFPKSREECLESSNESFNGEDKNEKAL